MVWGVLAVSPVVAQAPDGDFPVRNSGVGYIDSAIPGNVLRFRFDAAYGDHHPSRGEFFWARGPGGPGVPLPERNVDYQDLMGYLELLFGEHCSFFAEVPTRFLNPEVNNNTAGLGDVNAGLRWAFVHSEDCVLTAQFRTYAPSGDVHRGLGTGHVSLEPALLLFKPLTDTLTLEGEVRYWLPVGDAGFGGDLIRYGIGLDWRCFENEWCRVTPVIETVGWTFLHGTDAFVGPDGIPTTRDATGETIVNLKVGMRLGIGEHCDIYGGWGRPLTGDRWYQNTWRLELRLVF
jgi:hypothetical protein